MTKETRNSVLHLLGSIAFLSLPILSSPDFNTGQNLFKIAPFLNNFFRQVFLLLFFYVNYYFLLQNFYFKGKQVIYFIVLFFLMAIIISVPNLVFPMHFHEMKPHDVTEIPKKEPFLFKFFIQEGTMQFLLIAALSFLIKINQRYKEIKNEKQLTEISYLKAQINPHFLFNTLNSLYALTLQKSDEAPNAVLKLSTMMRYVVTESLQDFVPLEKEINYIKDYIDLQKLRIDDETELTVTIIGNPKGKVIAPLLLIPLIENAFKYGVNPDENSSITININMESDDFHLMVSNSIVNNTVSEDMKTEIGLENTKKRLEHIYPERHHLEVVKTDEIFTVTLLINL